MNAPSPTGATTALPFARLGPAGAPTPLVIAVPHAGRHYPPALLAQSRLPRAALETIEDRYADLLIEEAVRVGAVAIVARTARALLDLNRDPREIDGSIVRGGARPGAIASAKVAGGLGVVPSRIAAGGAVWRHPLEASEIAHRLATIHEPYHAAVAAALDAAWAAHGTAILIDCHSMPPLPRGAARIVLGDLHGTSTAPRFIRAAAATIEADGLSVARNAPYAGGYTLVRHGGGANGRHAFQMEIDRALYLDAALHEPGLGLEATRALVGAIARALLGETDFIALAAE